MNAKAYKFSPYLLEVEQKKLHRDGQLVPMTPKRFEILLLLIERAGQVVRKEEIRQRVWPGQEVEESNLTQHVFFLRRALGDDPRTPSYIMTIPGAGYLFYQPVQVVHEDGSEATIGGFQAQQSINLLGDHMAVAGNGPEEVVGTSRWSPNSLAIAGALLFVGLAAFSIWWWRSGREATPLPLPAVQPIVTMPGTKGDLSFARDGRSIAFTSEGDTVDSQNLFVQGLDQSKVTRLTKNAFNDHRLTWSPDNREIAFLRSGVLSNRKNKIIIIPSSGGGEERVVGEAWDGLDWSPDGRYLAICDSEGPGKPTGIYKLSLASKRIDPVSKPSPNENLFDSNPRFSPDGQSIAFTRWTSGANSDIFEINLTTGVLRQLTNDRARISSVQWSPSGEEILFVSNRTGNYRIWRVSTSGGAPAPIDGPLGEVEHFSVFRTEANENLLAYTQQFNDTNILVRNITGNAGKSDSSPGEAPCAINSTRADHSPQFSPDGSRILFISARSGFNELWLTDANCQNATQLTTFKDSTMGSPRWSPDGKQIVFDRLNNEQTDVYVYDLASTETRLLTNNQSPDFLPAWSADGREIFFCSERESSRGIWKVEVSSGETSRMTFNSGFESWATADGKSLYLTHYNSIFKLDLGSKLEQRVEELKDIFFGRYWTVQGDGIYYLTREVGNRSRIHRFDTKTAARTLVMELAGAPSKFVPGLSISPDEKRLVISLLNYNPGDISLIKGWR